MTRINLVDVSTLHDQHLMAEYREIFMVGSSLQRTLASKNCEKTLRNIPKQFTLNKGHVSFFYDKGLYLHKRYLELINELKKRNFKLSDDRVFKVEQWPKHLYNDWTPSDVDIALVTQRIEQRISLKPQWYRKTKPYTNSE